MKPFFFPLAAILSVAPVCLATSIYKCTTDSGVTYQSAPCTAGEVKVLPLPSLATVQPRKGDAVMVASVAFGGPLNLTSIHSGDDDLLPGMSDSQVLNHRRWGKPQRITRNRQARAWHEVWSYPNGPSGGTRLHFVNGMLASVANLQIEPTDVNVMPVAMFMTR